jgi:Uma2 family endonuclease
MQLIIDLPARDETLAHIRAGWQRAIADPQWSSFEGRFETNVFGEIIMSPPPPFDHNDRGFRIAHEIQNQLGGHAMTECPILTIDGVKVADAVWFTNERYELVRHQAAVETAPQICVEVVSPSNTDAEMRHKRRLYFESGAIECWTRQLDGTMCFYLSGDITNPTSQSNLCPDFPKMID